MGNRKDHIWAQAEGRHKTWGHRSDIACPPPQQARPVLYNIKWGGRVGALEASRGMETVQVASRAVPVPGPTAEQGVRAAMTDPGTRAAMADQGIRAAKAGSPPPQKKTILGKSTTTMDYNPKLWNMCLESCKVLTPSITSFKPCQHVTN